SSPGRAPGGLLVKCDQMPQALLGMELNDIREVLGPDRPAFRARQVYDALYHGQVGDLVQITTLPAAMRRELAQAHTVGLPEIERRYQSADGTRRYLL